MNNDDYHDMTRQFLNNVLEYAANVESKEKEKDSLLNESLEGTQYRTLTVSQLQAEYPDAYVGALQELEFDDPIATSESLEQDLISSSDKFVEDMMDGKLKWVGPTPWGGFTIVGVWSEETTMWDMLNLQQDTQDLVDIEQEDGETERFQRRITH